MKIITILLLGFATVLTAEEMTPLRKGDDAVRIREVLGEPAGYMETERQGVYYYDRGEVHTRNGKVTFVYLISEEELRQRKIALAEERNRRLLEGQAVLQDLEEQGGIGHLSGRQQLAYWTSFHEQYPEVNIEVPYRTAWTLAENEEREEREAARLAALEQRVLEAELRAARAQEQAARAQQTAATTRISSRTISYGWGWPSGYYIAPGCKRSGTPSPYSQPQISTRSVRVIPRLSSDTTLFGYGRR